MLKLHAFELAEGEYEANLPPRLAGGKPCYIRFKFKPGGSLNPEFLAGSEAIRHSELVFKRTLSRITDDEEYVKAELAFHTENGKRRFAVIYDACIVSWETNILSDGVPIETTRDNFLALAETKGVASIANAMLGLQAAIITAGADAVKADEETLKN